MKKIELPTMKQVSKKLKDTGKLNPLEEFIFNHEPLSLDGRCSFRVDLKDLITHLKDNNFYIDAS